MTSRNSRLANSRNYVLRAAIAAAAAGLGISATPAFSQQQSLEEITVTAQRREESLLETPVTVTALSGDLLETQNIRGLDEMALLTPGLGIPEPDGSRTALRLRGLATQDGSPAAENIAALHVDDIYISHRTTLQGYFYDIERVEVLQGPQGTLYGRNTAAGTINIRTARPQFEKEGHAEIEVGNYRHNRVMGMVNLPVSDTVAVRGAFQSTGRDSYFDANVAGRVPQNMFGRLSLQWNPNDRVSLFTKYDFGTAERSCNPVALIGTVDNSDPDNWQVTYFDDDTWFDDRLEHPNTQEGIALDECRRQESRADFWGIMGEFTWNITDNAQMIAVASRIEEKFFSIDGNQAQGFGYGVTGGLPQNGNQAPGTAWIEQTADLRFQGTLADQLDWTFGYFYWEDDTNEPAFNNGGIAFNARISLADSWAAYGQLAWTPPGIERLTITAGGRYTEDWKQWDFEVNFPFGTVGGSGGLLTTEWDNTDYKFGLSWALGDSGSVYANASTGYRAGSWFPGPLPSYDPEYVDAYEIGWKSRLMNNTMELSLNAYYYDYQDAAIGFDSINTLAPPGQQEELGYANLGNADVTGFNVNGSWLATDYDRIDFNLDITDAEFTSFDFASVAAEFPPFYDLSAVFNWEGLELPNTVPLRLTLAWTRDFELAGGAVFESRLQGVYTGSRYYGYRETTTVQYKFDGYEIDSYATLDWNARYQPAEGDWFVGLFVKNILDERYLFQVGGGGSGPDPALPIGQVPVPNGDDAYLTGWPGAPRTFGVRFGIDFF